MTYVRPEPPVTYVRPEPPVDDHGKSGGLVDRTTLPPGSSLEAVGDARPSWKVRNPSVSDGRGIAWAVAAAILFAIMNVTARLASAELAWPEIAAARAVVGALVAVGIALARGTPLAVANRRLAWTVSYTHLTLPTILRV